MSLRRFALASAGLAVLALAAAVPATAKEGVEATLKSTVPVDAPAGTRLNVRWTLGYVEDGEWHPFGASGLYVRLRSASGARPETAWAGGDRGSYWANVAVPKGGIGDIEFGLVGWQTDANGTRRADAIFPITNDPLPGVPGGGGASGASGPGSVTWILVAVGLLSLLAYLAFPLVRRRPFARLS